MAGKRPSTIDFGSLSKTKSGLEKITDRNVPRLRGVTALESYEKTAGKVNFLKSTKKVKPSSIGRKNKEQFSHLTKNKRVDKNDSLVTRFGKIIGLNPVLTKNI